MIHAVTGAKAKNTKSGGFKPHGLKQSMNGKDAVRTRMSRLTENEEAIERLTEAGFSSAFEIARIEENQFVRTYCDDACISITQGRTIHKRAQAVCEKVHNLLMNIRTSVGSPAFRAFAANTVGSDAAEYFEKLPEYRELFGDEQGCICDIDESIFGAPAYFTDLMRITDKYITAVNPEIPERLRLSARRPDLWEIPLSKEAAREEVPYVQIVNERLLSVMPGEEDPYQTMAVNFIHPFLFPANIHLLRLRACLAERGTDLAALYGLFGDQALAQGREAMGVSPEQWDLILHPRTETEALKAVYGLEEKEALAELADAEVYQRQSGLAKEELAELLNQGLSPAEAKTAHQFYFNCCLKEEGAVTLSEDGRRLNNLTEEALDRLHRFLRLQRALQIPAASLDRLLSALDMRKDDIRETLPEDLHVLLKVMKDWTLSAEDVCDLLTPLRCYGQEVKGGTSYRQIFQGSQAASYHPQNPWNETYEDALWTWTPFGDEKNHSQRTAWLAQGLGIAADDVEELGRALFVKKTELSLENLSALYRWVKLARIFKVPVSAMLLFAKTAGIKPSTQFTAADLAVLSQLYEFVQEYSLTAYQLDYFLSGKENGYVKHLYLEDRLTGWMKELRTQYGSEMEEELFFQELAAFLQIEKDTLKTFFPLASYWVCMPAGVCSWIKAALAPPKAGSELPEYFTEVTELLHACSRWVKLGMFIPQAADFWQAIGRLPQAYNIPAREQADTFFWLHQLLQIQVWENAYGDGEGKFLESLVLLYQGSEEGLPLLADAMGRKMDEIHALYLGFTETTECPLERTARLVNLHQGMLHLNLTPELLQDFKALAGFSADKWEEYQNAADLMSQCILRFYQGESKAVLQKKLQSAADGIKRELLLARAIPVLHGLYADIKNADDVYKFLLIDVQMGEETEVSYLCEGISAVQLYLQRCRLKLERGVKHQDIPESWWEWIISMPLWEANRKIFVYPENYLLPSLRHSKTSLFQNLENELSQGELTAANVEDAFQEYLDAFSAVSTLSIVESYECEVPDEKGVLTPTYFLFGRTKTQPYGYYYCLCKSGHPWSEWMKIDVDIHSDKLTPVYVFGSLYLFWLEKKETSASRIAAKDGGAASEASKSHHLSICYTYQNLRKEWMPCQNLEEDRLVYYSDFGASPTLAQNKELLDAYHLDEIPWQKLCAIPVDARSFDAGAGKKEDFERLILFFGEHFQYAGDVIETKPVKADGSDRSSFEEDLYDRFHLYNRMVKTNELGYLHVQDTLVLNRDLQADHLFEGSEYLLIDGSWQVTAPVPFKPVMDSIHHSLGIRYTGTAILDNYISDTKTVELHQFQRQSSGTNAFTSPSIDVQMSAAIHEALEKSGIMDFQGHLRINKLADYDLSDLAALIREKSGGKAFSQSQLLHLLEVLLERNGGVTLFHQVGQPEAALYPVLNKVGDFILNNGDETFLLSYQGDFKTLSGGVQVRRPEVNELTMRTISESLKESQIALRLKESQIIAEDGSIREELVTRESIREVLASTASVSDGELESIYRVLKGYPVVEEKDFYCDTIEMELSEQIHQALKKKTVISDCGRVDMSQLLDKDPQIVLSELLDDGKISAPMIAGIYRQILKTPAAVCLRYQSGEAQEKVNDLKEVQYSVVRLSTHAVSPLRQRLSHGGIKRLLSIESQQIPVEPAFPFERLAADYERVAPPAALDGEQVDFDGLYGEYFWEIFYHLPMNIAAALQADQKFEEAQKWMQYIFLPSAEECFVNGSTLYEESGGKIDQDMAQKIAAALIIRGMIDEEGRVADSFNMSSDLSFLLELTNMTEYKLVMVRRILLNYQLAVPSAYYWQFYPFRHHGLEVLTEILDDEHPAMKVYNDDPFDPHAIARLRIGAYEKYTVSQYIQNILSWGDQLFAEDTWEALTRATMLYTLALSMLGRKPEIAASRERQAKTFADLQARPGEIPQILIHLEDNIAEDVTLPAKEEHFMGEPQLYFAIPENEQLLSLWDFIEDRLSKIRASMNIKGEKRKLALYSPSIDPLLPARTAASGGSGTESLLQQAPLLNFRFSFLLEKAKDFCREIGQMGQELLSVLEKEDAESIALLHTSQEKAMLNLLTAMKNYQIAQAEAEKQSLLNMSAAAEKRFDYYQKLVTDGLLQEESNQLDFMKRSRDSGIAANVLHTAAGIGYAVPQVGSPFAMTYGGVQLGAVITAGAAAADLTALVYNYKADRSRICGEHKRREEEWKFQVEQADCDKKGLESQLAGVETRQLEAAQDLRCHQESIGQNEEMYAALCGKFTNQELYLWMKSRLAGIYWQLYQMGLTLALQAEKAYQLEFDTQESFLSFQCWDSLRAGLLCSENLSLSLRKLEHAALQKGSRTLEVEKVISLAETCPEELIRLKQTGSCTFEVTEMMLDSDFPGHYARKISGISVTLPAVTGPYDTIKASLTQTGNLIVTKPDQEDVRMLLEGKDASGEGIRKNWLAGQKVILSRGVEDNGVLVPVPDDERYMPFEYTGAVSQWELEMPLETNEISFASISDVILRLTYTAKEDHQLKGAVKDFLKTYPRQSSLLYYLQQHFSSSWNAFMEDHSVLETQSFCVELGFEHMRTMNKNRITDVYFYVETDMEIRWEQAAPFLTVSLPNGKEYPVAFAERIGRLELEGEEIGVPKGEWKLHFQLDAMKKEKQFDAILKDGFLDREKVKGIEMLVAYEGWIY